MMSAHNDCTHYYQTNASIDFWYKQKLNFRSLIQLSEIFLFQEKKISKTLLVELTGTHYTTIYIYIKKNLEFNLVGY